MYTVNVPCCSRGVLIFVQNLVGTMKRYSIKQREAIARKKFPIQAEVKNCDLHI
jgi:hypothetical protein